LLSHVRPESIEPGVFIEKSIDHEDVARRIKAVLG